MEIITVKKYDGIPVIVKAFDGRIFQLNYYDSKGRFRKYKLLKPREHNGSSYYRIGGVRYSEQKLLSMEIRCIKKINLDKKIAKWK